MKQRIQPLWNFCELHPFGLEDLTNQLVAVDVLSLVRILEEIIN